MTLQHKKTLKKRFNETGLNEKREEGGNTL